MRAGKHNLLCYFVEAWVVVLLRYFGQNLTQHLLQNEELRHLLGDEIYLHSEQTVNQDSGESGNSELMSQQR